MLCRHRWIPTLLRMHKTHVSATGPDAAAPLAIVSNFRKRSTDMRPAAGGRGQAAIGSWRP